MARKRTWIVISGCTWSWRGRIRRRWRSRTGLRACRSVLPNRALPADREMGGEGVGKPFVGGHKRSFGGDRQRDIGTVVDRTLKAGRSEERRVGKECRSRWSP